MIESQEEFIWASRSWLCPRDGMILIFETDENHDLRCEDCGLTYRICSNEHAVLSTLSEDKVDE